MNKFSTIALLNNVILHIHSELQWFVVKRYKCGIAVQEVSGTQGKEAFVVIVVV
jgi:hypothetical protein